MICEVTPLGEAWTCEYHNVQMPDLTGVAEHVVKRQYKVDDSNSKLGGASDSSEYSSKLPRSRNRPTRQRKNYMVSRDRSERQGYR